MIKVFLAVLLMGSSVIEYRRPPLTKYQLNAFFNPARMVVIEGTTKTGKNYGGLAWFFELATIVPKYLNYWWVEPVYGQATISYRRLKRSIPESLRRPNDSELTLTLPNERILWFKSGEKPDNLYGEDVGGAVVNEASRFREESFHAIRTTLTATRGPIRIMGNLKGKKNWFYKMARKAEAGQSDTHYAKFVSMDAVKAGILDAREIEDARRDLPNRVFRELYLGEASEDGSNPFGADAIHAQIKGMGPGPAIAFGVDLAKSQDWTVVHGINQAGQTCVWERYQRPWQETIERVRATIGLIPALVDATGVGDPIVEALQRGGRNNVQGFKFTGESKQRIMEGLAVAIQRGDVSYPDGTIVHELEAFEFIYTGRGGTSTGVKYSAPEGMHDDCVCALALAVARRSPHYGAVQTWGPA